VKLVYSFTVYFSYSTKYLFQNKTYFLATLTLKKVFQDLWFYLPFFVESTVYTTTNFFLFRMYLETFSFSKVKLFPFIVSSPLLNF